ncbi:MAG TPA: response regulator, partial [Arenicellales bacterium]|nr:response regulator [Arenicellales bacterium]
LMWERLNSIQELVEMRSLSSARTLAAAQSGVEPVFDSLEMDEYNELHSATSFLAESIMDTREYTSGIRDELARLKTMLKQQDVLSRELNETVMGTRMVPFRSLVPRLKRVVRQTARATGKSVDLEVQGEEVLVDSAVLNRLADPLMHMLRNAIDHGIESAGERTGAGKPAEGRVEVRVERHGDNVSLLVRDDGRGLDYERIRRTGLDKGLVRGDPSAMSEQELARLILVPGFSTRGEANQISGRGIGMDVVNSVVMEQRGTLDVESEPGRGMSVMIRVPMTLISVHTLLVRNAGVVLGIPSSSVQQLIFSDLGEWQRRDGEVFFEFEEREYRVVPLSRLVGLDPAMPEIDGAKPVPLLLVQGEREASAVILEEVLDSRYLVVKRLGRYVPQTPGVIGGAILADGSVAGVVDVRELLRQRSEGLPAMRQRADGPVVDRSRALPLVLVVDDSVSARRTLSELVADAGYRAATAVDGLAALSSIDQEKPAAILTDMEMPRMNGLELAAHLRADRATSAIPLLMITSRSTEKHRRQAETAGVDRYFTKPYQEDAVVEALNSVIASAARD